MGSFDSISPWLKIDLETWKVFMQPQYLVTFPADAIIHGQNRNNDFVYLVGPVA